VYFFYPFRGRGFLTFAPAMVTHTPVHASASTRGYAAIVSSAMIWGINGTFVQFVISSRHINIEWLLTIRLLIPGIILLLLAAAKRDGNSIWAIWQNPKDAIAVLAFTFGLVAVQYTFLAAIRASNAATATILQFSAPAVVAAYYLISGRKTAAGRDILVIVLAIAGTFLIATHGNIRTIVISPAALTWGLVSAAALAFYSIQPVRILHKYKPNAVVGWGMLLGGLAFSGVHAPWQITGEWDTYTALMVAFIVIPGGLLAFSLYLRGVKLIGGYVAMLLTSFEPLTATVISVLWLHIRFGWPEVIGGVLIVGTIFLLPKEKGEV
jgi:drug/metabolite transporter (DMT)-like permease